ncbi:MAG: hypothetical protein JF621_09205 [Streptomyces turgidiscabies]|nr:hypothetical protein [Streptomyces turgidiscabies]
MEPDVPDGRRGTRPVRRPGGEPGHLWAAVAWPLALLAVFFPLAVRKFGRPIR